MTPITQPGKFGKRLTPSQKQTLVKGVVSGRSQKQVALELGVNPDTVSKVVRNSLGTQWRSTLEGSLDPAADTIALAVRDINDLHKASADAFKLFQGLGLLNGEQQTTVLNVLTIVNQALPPDMQFDMLSTSDAIDAQVLDSKDSTKP